MVQTKVNDTLFQSWLAERKAQDMWRQAERQAISAAHGELDEYVPIRAFRVLWRLLNRQGLKVTPQNVAGLTARELMAQDGFGRKSLADVEQWLGHYGLRLEGVRRFKVSLHTTEGARYQQGRCAWTTEQVGSWLDGFERQRSLRLLADALDVLHA